MQCDDFIWSSDFKKQFGEILDHDRELFDEPIGWKTKLATESPLIFDFENLWHKLKDIYSTELSALAYSPIPDEKVIANSFTEIINLIK